MKKETAICPCCQSECKVDKYNDEVGLVEIDFKCKCGYHYSWAYGKEEIEYPEGYDE